MSRLTTNKPVSEMGMCELAHNSCFAKNKEAFYRDFNREISARDFARELAKMFNYELPEDNELFDDEIIDDLQFVGITPERGLIALFYRNLWAQADLYETLKRFEDLQESGKLIELPCAVGDTVYEVFYDELNNPQYYICKYEIEDVSVKAIKYADDWISWEELNDTYFDRKEAEKRLKELLEGTC